METVNQIEYNGNLYNVKDAEAQKSLVYSQNETDTGKIWIDGKKIFRKIVNCGELPNNDDKIIPHNIKDYDIFLTVKGIAIAREARHFLFLPFPSYGNESMGVSVLKENIWIRTYMDRRYFSESYITLEYTKTTN